MTHFRRHCEWFERESELRSLTSFHSLQLGSMSAIIPPKRPPRSPLKLQLPGTPSSDPPTPANRPKLSLASTPEPSPSSSSTKPSLKLSSVSNKLATLSLNVPSRYASALNGPSESDTELDDNDDSRPWALGEQERMAGELLDVINGPSAVGLEDELSGKTRRPRSASRVSSRPSSSGSNAAGNDHSTTMPTKVFGGNGMLSPPLTLPTQVSSAHSKIAVQGGGGGGSAIHHDEGHDDDQEDELDISPSALQDLGRLGEGASGEVRKVLHKPTGLVMAKKVS